MNTEPTHPLLEAVRQLGPAVTAAATQTEKGGCIAPDLAAALTDTGVFQMYLPADLGGHEVTPMVGFEIGEELARRDGSVGWCAQVAAAVAVFLAWLDPEELARMREMTPDPLHVAGSARPLGAAVAVDGGYRVSGHWNFSSGVRHANWFLATSFEEQADGSQRPRSMLVPVGEGQIVDNWTVMGMRGTGSDDFVLDDVFVPHARVGSRRWVLQRPEPLYDPRLMMIAAWAPAAGVANGLARGAIDALVELGDQTSAGSSQRLSERPAVQAAVGEAESITSATRAFSIDAIAAAWRAHLDDSADLGRCVARAQLAITHSFNEAVRVADICFHAAGTNAISSANRLERFLRDAHTAVMHAAGQPIHRQVAGRVLLGLPAGELDPNRDGPSTPRS
ncbi:MAG: alkylation response protein AidB-like acyl-CoA dehydrogenase [Candidatus Poriferisodalaceae bacterium]